MIINLTPEAAKILSEALAQYVEQGESGGSWLEPAVELHKKVETAKAVLETIKEKPP